MADKKDSEAYKEGHRDREDSFVDQFITDLFGNFPSTDAYYKGRRGEKFDAEEGGKGDKDKKEK